MSEQGRPTPSSSRADAAIRWTFLGVEYAVVVCLLVVGAIVLVWTVSGFVHHPREFSATAVVSAIDGILLVIIILDIAHTVFGHLRASVFPVRPFLVVGILAGVRDILSASAHLALSEHLSESDFHDTLIQLGIGVGVVLALLLGLWILHITGDVEETP